ncbi:MAG: ABC transporter permease [Acidobacteriia bacterium]|nr:ABC transporter permease [Terriglobia bacterium]
MTTLHHLRFALRLIARNPMFAVVSIATLGIGIGANTAIFSAVDAVLLHPLRYKHPNQLVLVTKNMPMFELTKSDASALDFLDYRDLSRSFSHMATFDLNSVNLTGDQEPIRVFGLRASASLLPMLGVRPIAGRFFGIDEENPARNHVVVLGAGLWKDRFASDPGIIGKQIQLNAESFTVIGVVEPVLQFLEPSQIYFPLTFKPEELDPNARGHQKFAVLARLQGGVTLQQARSEMKVVAARMTQHLPGWYPKGWSIDVDPLAESVAGEMRTPLLVLLAAVGIVLLIASANVANLLLARATSRQKEIGIRTALGAARRQIIAQLLSESIVLAAVSGLVGLCIGVWLLDLFVRFGPPDLFLGQNLEVNSFVAIFTFGLALVTTLLFGLAPAITASRIDLNEALKAGMRGAAGGRHGGRMRGSLVVSEVALSLVLLIGAGLLIRSFERLEGANPGFRTDHLLTARLSLPVLQYREPSQITGFYSELHARVVALPGVTSAALANGVPFGAGSGGGSFNIAGRPWPPSEPVPDVDRRIASPGYFETLGIPLKQGRTFAGYDAGEAPRVAVVDEIFAKTFFPAGDAIGQRVSGPGQAGYYQIVGIVGAAKDRSLLDEPKARIYYPSLQTPYFYMTLIVRTAGDPMRIIPAIQREVRALDRNLPVYKIATMDDLLADSLQRRRISMLMLAILAGVALLLSAIGIYGVVAYSVSRRTAEIGIRMALGAEAGDVLRMVLRQAMRPVIAGIVIGLLLAAGVTRLLSSLLYHVSATDSFTFVSVPVILLLIALAAALVPARRATSVAPTTALHYE